MDRKKKIKWVAGFGLLVATVALAVPPRVIINPSGGDVEFRRPTSGGNSELVGKIGTTAGAPMEFNLGVQIPSGQALNLAGMTASQAVFTDASKNLISNAITGTGNVVMSTSPSLTTPTLSGGTLSGTIAGTPTWSGAHTWAATSVLQTLNSTATTGASTLRFSENGTEKVKFQYLNSGFTAGAGGYANRLWLTVDESEGALSFDIGDSTVSAVPWARFAPAAITLAKPVTLSGGLATQTISGAVTWSGTTIWTTPGTGTVPVIDAAASQAGFLRFSRSGSPKGYIGLGSGASDNLTVQSVGVLTLTTNSSAGTIVMSPNGVTSATFSPSYIEINQPLSNNYGAANPALTARTASDTWASFFQFGRNTTTDAKIGVGGSAELLITGAGGGDLNLVVNGSSRFINLSNDSGTSFTARFGPTQINLPKPVTMAAASVSGVLRTYSASFSHALTANTTTDLFKMTVAYQGVPYQLTYYCTHGNVSEGFYNAILTGYGVNSPTRAATTAADSFVLEHILVSAGVYKVRMRNSSALPANAICYVSAMIYGGIKPTAIIGTLSI